MHLVLDANEYIFAFGIAKDPVCVSFLTRLAENPSCHKISVCRRIIREVRINLSPKEFQNFFNFLNLFTIVEEDFVVSFNIAFKYEREGLKPSDAFIAAYAEWTGADVLVSENRHFLTRKRGLPFKVLSAKKCLKLI